MSPDNELHFKANGNEQIKSRGSLELLTGGVKAGKKEEAARRVRRALIVGQTAQVFIAEDTKWEIRNNGESLQAQYVTDVDKLREMVDPQSALVVIASAQNLTGIADYADELAAYGKRVIVTALDMDHFGDGYPETELLLAKAEFVDKLHAICQICGEEASFSQLLEDGSYEPRCRVDFRR